MNKRNIPWWVSSAQNDCTQSLFVFHLEERENLKLALRVAKDQALLNASLCMKQNDTEMLQIRDLFFAQKRSRSFDIFVLIENTQKKSSG